MLTELWYAVVYYWQMFRKGSSVCYLSLLDKGQQTQLRELIETALKYEQLTDPEERCAILTKLQQMIGEINIFTYQKRFIPALWELFWDMVNMREYKNVVAVGYVFNRSAPYLSVDRFSDLMHKVKPDIDRAHKMMVKLDIICKLNYEVGVQLHKKQPYTLRKTTDMDKGEALERVYRIASAMMEHGRLSDEAVIKTALKEIMVESLHGLGTEY